jgi:glycerol-3-phosphate acyltransferase PlsY
MNLNLLFKIIFVIFSYLLGSIPNAFFIYKIYKGGDIRQYGSGNVGGTNVLRTAGIKPGILTIILDVIKGAIPVILIYLFFPSSYILYIISTVAVLLGHVFPVFLNFKGGKGVATSGGLLLATCILPFSGMNLAIRLAPAITMFVIIVTIALITKIMSIGSITAAIISPIVFFLAGYDNYIVISSIIWSIIIIVTHRQNIKRLVKGEEKKILNKKKEV